MKPSEGGSWLASQRRALGLTGDALGAALGISGATVRAIECGARPLGPQIRARAEAYFAKELLREPVRSREIPPEGLVHVDAWVRPETLTAALAEASAQDVDVELIVGRWADAAHGASAPERRRGRSRGPGPPARGE